jgi:hypothetical protein
VHKIVKHALFFRILATGDHLATGRDTDLGEASCSGLIWTDYPIGQKQKRERTAAALTARGCAR